MDDLGSVISLYSDHSDEANTTRKSETKDRHASRSQSWQGDGGTPDKRVEQERSDPSNSEDSKDRQMTEGIADKSSGKKTQLESIADCIRSKYEDINDNYNKQDINFCIV